MGSGVNIRRLKKILFFTVITLMCGSVRFYQAHIFIVCQDIPTDAVELFARRVKSGQACPPIAGELKFDEPNVMEDHGRLFVTGNFMGNGDEYRYRLMLHKIPLVNHYLYDTRVDFPHKDIQADDALYMDITGVFLHYTGWVSLSETQMNVRPSNLVYECFCGLIVTAGIYLYIRKRT